MKRLNTKHWAWVVAVCLLIGGVAPHALGAVSLNGLQLAEPGKAAAKPYTALQFMGLNGALYAFTDAAGRTQYRLYGGLNGQVGFYEALLTAPAAAGGEYTLSLNGTAPVRDQPNSFAAFSVPAQRSQTAVPAGFQQGNGKGIVYLRNYFNQLEYLVYGSLDQINWQYYHTDGYAKPMRGGLPVLPDSLLPRARAYQTYLLPAIYKQAERLPAQYAVITSDGQPAVLPGITQVIPENQLPVAPVAEAKATRRPDSGLPLSQGSHGKLVSSVQTRLNALLYSAGKVDGLYGQQTAAAVSAFQQVNGLALSGKLDQAAYNHLMSQSALINPHPGVTPAPQPPVTPKPEASYTGSHTVKVHTSGGLLNLLSIPNPTKRAKYSIAKIPNGTVLTGVAKGNQGFSKLVYQGLEGYVDNSYLVFDVPTPQPVTSTPGTPAPTAAPTPAPVYEGNFNAKVRTTGGELNLWSIPNPTKRSKYSIAKIPNETMLTGVQKGTDGFCKLIYKDLEGYVDIKYLDFNVPQPATP